MISSAITATYKNVRQISYMQDSIALYSAGAFIHVLVKSVVYMIFVLKYWIMHDYVLYILNTKSLIYKQSL